MVVFLTNLINFIVKYKSLIPDSILKNKKDFPFAYSKESPKSGDIYFIDNEMCRHWRKDNNHYKLNKRGRPMENHIRL